VGRVSGKGTEVSEEKWKGMEGEGKRRGARGIGFAPRDQRG